VFKDLRHSDIVYTNVLRFLKERGREYRRIDLLGGPTLCVERCDEALEAYRELTLLVRV
jgi:Iap family predicted aminopeptidase